MQVSNAARRSEPVASDAMLRAERGGMVVKRLKEEIINDEPYNHYIV